VKYILVELSICWCCDDL